MTLDDRRKMLAQFQSMPGNQPDNRSIGQKILENIGTGGYNAANSILMGLPDFLVKNLAGDAYKGIQELRSRNQEAATVGDIGGTIGSMFIPGGAIVKGLGAGAKALGAAETAAKLGKAAEFLKGTELTGNLGQKIATSALRGAGQAAEQAIPRALTNLDFTEGGKNLGQSAAEGAASLPLSIGLGGLAGGLLGPLASKLVQKGSKTTKGVGSNMPEHILDEARETLDKQLIKNTGQDNRTLRDAAKFFMPTKQALGDGGDEYVRNYAQFLRDNGIRGKKNFQDMWENLKQDYAKADNAFNQSAPVNWKENLLESMARDPEIKGAMAGNKAAERRLGELTQTITADRNKSVSDIRNNLTQIARDNMKSPNPADQALSRAAFAAKNHVDDFTSDTIKPVLGDEFVDSLKYRYKNLQPLLMHEGKEAFTLPSISGGSPTFEKTVGGALLGGLGGAQVRDEDGNIDIGKTLTGAVGGAILGNAANKIIPKVLPKATSEINRAASGLLANPKIAKFVETQVPKALTGVGENAGRATAAMTSQEMLHNAKKSDNPAETVTAKEAALPPEEAATAKAEFSQKFKDTMNAQLGQIYQEYYSDMNPQDFIQKVSAQTNNFQDMPAMANILFLGNPKGQENFLRKYDAYLTLKHIDIDKALKGGGGILGIGADEQANKDQELLANTLMSLQTEGDVTKRTPAQEKILKDYMKRAAKDPQILAQFMKEYGLDFADLAQMGLA
jgi:hypothetical protein